MINKILLTLVLIIASSSCLMHAVGQDSPVSPEMQAELNSRYEHLEALKKISADREGAISALMAIWEPKAAALGYTDGWKEEFTAALTTAADQTLLDIQTAKSYSEVQALLQGLNSPVAIEGALRINALGDLTEDLSYTPVVPCRIFDTRYGAGGTPAGGNPGTIRSYWVYGDATLLSQQGHTAGTGCDAPRGEPVAIAANFTVVPYGKGHIRVWPYDAPQPNASFLNYNTPVNSNLANAGIIQTCYLCTKDIHVSTWFGSADSLADVMGYFYPAQQVPPSVVSVSTVSTNMSTCVNHTGAFVTITVPGSGYVTVTAQAVVRVLHSQGLTSEAYIYIGSSDSECTFYDSTTGYHASMHNVGTNIPGGIYFFTIPVTRVYPVDAGTHTYYLNGDDGYGSTNVIQFLHSSMQAHFTAN